MFLKYGVLIKIEILDVKIAEIIKGLDCATNGKSDGYIKLKIEKAISMIDVLMDIVEFE